MSISQQIQALNTSRQNIAAAITQKGGTVSENDGFSQFATAITNLPSGGSNADLIDLIEGDITTLNIPSGTTMIGNYAIANKPNLASVTIPNSVTSIGNNAFQSCSSLASVTIPNSVTSIGNGAFSDCSSLASVTIPNNVTSIEAGLFYSCTSLANVTIPSSVTIIKTAAFYNCTNLKSLTIPSTVTQIGNDQWGNGVFTDCRNLTALICLPTTPPTAMNLNLQYTTNYIYVPSESVAAYKAASGWSSYASRIYPIQQVATVDGNPVYNYEIGDTDGAVLGSSEMAKMPTGTSLELAEGITSVQGVINGYTTVSLPSTMSYLGVQEVIGSSVTTLTCLADTPPSVQANNLGGSGLTAIYVPVQCVNDYKADSGWSTHSSIIQAVTYRLATLTLSDDTEVEITSDTTTLTRALVSTPYKTTLVSASIAPNTTVIGEKAFYNCTLMTSVTFESGSACETIYNRAFYDCSGLTSITLPNTVTSIGEYAFLGTALTSITIPDSVTSFGSSAFKNCSGLMSMTIPNSVTEIGSLAFMGCESLESATIGSGLTEIGEGVFLGCESLTSVTMLGETPPSLIDDAGDTFAYGESGINTLYVPSASVSAYQTWVDEMLGAGSITVEAIPAE